MQNASLVVKMARSNIVRCGKCLNPTIKLQGEGYDVDEAEHTVFLIGRTCKRCKIIYLNPKFENYTVKWDRNMFKVVAL